MAKKSWWNRRTATMRATIAGGLLALVGTITAVVIPLVAKPDGAVELQVIDVEVERGTPYVAGDQVSIAVTLLNKGDARGVVSEARFIVEDVLRIEPCVAPGKLEVSGVYDLTLPVDAATGDRFHVDVSQELGPDQADRFAIRTQLAEALHHPYTLFRLRAAFDVNGGEYTIDVGSVVLSLPGSFTPVGVYATDGIEEFLTNDRIVPPRVDEVRTCLYDNSAKLHQFLAEPAPRPDDLEDVYAALRLRP